MYKPGFILLATILLQSATIHAQDSGARSASPSISINADTSTTGIMTDENRYQLLLKVTQGSARLTDVEQLLSNTDDVAALTNALHALYSMRWHRGVNNLLDDIWAGNRNKYPGLAWDALNKIPARIALASTINRIRIFNTQEYKEYIYAHKYDEHEFHRAQAVISLGLNGDPADIPYLQEMAEGNNVYVAQSAITALGLLVHPKSKEALIALSKKFHDDERGQLIREVFKKAYPLRQ